MAENPAYALLDRIWQAVQRPLHDLADGNRGGAKRLAFDAPEVTVVQSKASLRGNAGENIDVTLGIRTLPDEAGESEAVYYLPMVRARLSWGVGNVSLEAECDWLHGTRVSLGAENVRVEARFVEVFGVGDLKPESVCPPAFEVTATLTYGGVGKNSNPARLTEVAQIAEVGTVRVPIPAFATSFTVVPVLPDAGTIRVRQVGLGTLFRATYDVEAPLSNAGQYDVEAAFPVFEGGRCLEIDNLGPGPLVALVVFGLSL